MTPEGFRTRRADLQVRLRDGRPQGPAAGEARDIIAAAKASPGSITVATAGVGTGQQLVAAAFMKAAGVKLQEVPYKGSPPAFTDLLAGRIDLFFDSAARACLT